ncbi:MAG: hypothetical protein GX100_06235 [candidate division WS1 bacterium]|jgi:menaquinone-dependent protoporphyrinogen oxidase|nr:hypothetical protein [candidate division WS1 bacterium]
MRVLIAYASGFGATAEVAKEIGKVLAESHTVEVQPMAKVQSLAPFDAVLLGSSIRAGRWLGGLPRFLQRFRRELETTPFAIFAVALTARTLEGSRRLLAESLPQLLQRFPELEPFASQAFGGVLDYDRYNLAVRMVMRRVAQSEGLPTSGLQDFRDWQAIRAWAQELSQQLQAKEMT